MAPSVQLSEASLPALLPPTPARPLCAPPLLLPHLASPPPPRLPSPCPLRPRTVGLGVGRRPPLASFSRSPLAPLPPPPSHSVRLPLALCSPGRPPPLPLVLRSRSRPGPCPSPAGFLSLALPPSPGRGRGGRPRRLAGACVSPAARGGGGYVKKSKTTPCTVEMLLLTLTGISNNQPPEMPYRLDLNSSRFRVYCRSTGPTRGNGPILRML